MNTGSFLSWLRHELGERLLDHEPRIGVDFERSQGVHRSIRSSKKAVRIYVIAELQATGGGVAEDGAEKGDCVADFIALRNGGGNGQKRGTVALRSEAFQCVADEGRQVLVLLRLSTDVNRL